MLSVRVYEWLLQIVTTLEGASGITFIKPNWQKIINFIDVNLPCLKKSKINFVKDTAKTQQRTELRKLSSWPSLPDAEGFTSRVNKITLKHLLIYSVYAITELREKKQSLTFLMALILQAVKHTKTKTLLIKTKEMSCWKKKTKMSMLVKLHNK